VHRFRDMTVAGLAFHSSETRPGNLFFAIRGTRQNGAVYAAQALARGACAIVAEEVLAVTCPVLVVEDARRALADAACLYYRFPSRSLQVIGVTGTNGKTTTAHLIRHCLEADRRQTGMMGTISYSFGGRQIPSNTTTPDPVRMQGYLREMVDRFAGACVLEVSSHSLHQDRVRGVEFSSAVFLNLSQDHLDYHGTMENYAAAKAQLFAGLAPDSSACLSADSPASAIMRDALRPGVREITFGLHQDAEIRAENVVCRGDGTRMDLVMPRGRAELQLGLLGPHNVQNALAAAAAALAMGVSELTIVSALEASRPVRGRMESVGVLDGKRVLVDYAHTPQALQTVCASLAAMTKGRLVVVFGCGGDRDRGKRSQMTRAVATHAHVGYLTSDNPRSEDPEAILDEMEPGLVGASGNFYRVTDRAAAIRRAVREARDGDTVLIAGKGHETYQILRDSVVPFDDALIAREALFGEES
jgi:UDP-N-acetylmuramoyl-L-alanyl-D-glutamate--2,6-diaminopimelate ligase